VAAAFIAAGCESAAPRARPKAV